MLHPMLDQELEAGSEGSHHDQGAREHVRIVPLHLQAVVRDKGGDNLGLHVVRGRRRVAHELLCVLIVFKVTPHFPLRLPFAASPESTRLARPGGRAGGGGGGGGAAAEFVGL